MPNSQRRRGSVLFRLVTLTFLSVGLIAAAGASAVALSPAERAFSSAYEKLVPTLNRASAALVGAVNGSGHDTDAQIVTIFTGVARQWASATRPLLALRAPAPEAPIFAVVSRYARAVKADLLAVAQSGRTHSVPAAKAGGTRLALDFNALAREVKLLKAELGLH